MSGANQGGAAAGCPVCGLPSGTESQSPRSESQCPECGWTLRSPLRVGPVTGQLRAEFTLRLHDAQRALDERVAARVAADSRPCHRYIRGGAPDDARWAAARRDAGLEISDAADEAALHARLADLANGLRPGLQAVIVEAGTGGIAVSRAGLDSFGLPWLDRAPGTAWSALLPMLSAAKDEQHFQLAGGLARLDRTAISDRLRSIPADFPDGDLLVICRPAGWLVLERAAAAVLEARPGAQVLRVAGAGGMPAGTILAGLTTEAPLRDAYHLMVAEVDEVSGEVRTQTRQMFAPGDVPGTESSLSLRRPPGDGKETALAIISGSSGEPFALYSAPLPSQQAFDLRAILDGPGQVRITEPPGAMAHDRTWTQVRSDIPDRVEVTAQPADLVCAVDLAGPSREVRARLRLLRMLLARLAVEYPEPGRLRAAVLTCTDHVFERGQEYRTVVRGIELGPVPVTEAWFARQEAVSATYEQAAPIEDLLHEASIMLAASRAAGRAARLLTVAGRCPHPFPQDAGRIMRCPLQYKWREIMRQLTGPVGARCVAVADAVPGNRAQAAIWRELGPAGLHGLAEATERLVGEDLALFAKHTRRIPIPLPEPE